MANSSSVYAIDKNTGEYVKIRELHGDENRMEITNYSDIPEDVINCLVAAEDHRYWQHNGVDWKRTAASTLTFFTQSSSQGGSTITQQVIKNLTGPNEFSPERKIKEIFQKISNYLSIYAKSLFVYNSATKTVSIRGVVVSSAVDTICILLMRSAVYNGLKYGMKVLLQNNTIRKEFVKQMFDFFVNTWGGRLILKTLVTIGFAVAGVRWSESVKNAFISLLLMKLKISYWKIV